MDMLISTSCDEKGVYYELNGKKYRYKRMEIHRDDYSLLCRVVHIYEPEEKEKTEDEENKL